MEFFLLGFKLPKYGKVFPHEELGKIVFNPMLDDKTHSRIITASPRKKETQTKFLVSLVRVSFTEIKTNAYNKT